MTDLNRILHVEDDHDIREIARMSLEMIGGFTLLQCSSGREAVEKAADFAPLLLLLDVMMPGMGGEETLMELRQLEATKDCPAVFVTAKAQDREVSELLANSQADGVIIKPFDPMLLPDEVKSIWKKTQTK